MKKKSIQSLKLRKKTISKLHENANTGGDVSLPNPATAIRCDLTGGFICNSWVACNSRPENITCIYITTTISL